MRRIVQRFETALTKFIYTLAFVGMSVVVLMVALTAGDAVMRSFFNRPITGASEASEFMLTIMIFFGLAYTAMEKGHIEVDLLFSKFPKRVQPFLNILTSFISLVIFSLITWRTCAYALKIMRDNVLSPTLTIPIYPFVFVTSLGAGLLSLVLLRDLVHSFSELGREK